MEFFHKILKLGVNQYCSIKANTKDKNGVKYSFNKSQCVEVFNPYGYHKSKNLVAPLKIFYLNQ